MAKTVQTIRANLKTALEDPAATTRLWTQGDQYWFSDASPEEIIEAIVLVDENGSGLAREQRFRDGRGNLAVPAAVCVVEPSAEEDDEACNATWLFRHDVVDGWRCLRYMCSLCLEDTVLTLNRLRERHEKKVQRARASAPPVKVMRGSAKAAAVTVLSPLAASRLASIAIGSCRALGERRHFYMHATISLAGLKKLSAAHKLGSVSTTLTACIAAAFFAADATRKRAVVGSNVLFDPDAPDGNHVCVKAATLRRRSTDEGTLKSAARAMNSRSQALADLVSASVTRKYVRGELGASADKAINKRHAAMDFLVSNLPAFDASRPSVLGLQTSRDFCDWNPSIVYAIGVEDALFCDFYFGVRPSFSEDDFMRTFTTLTSATGVHNNLPKCY